jgi:5'-3' exonuclease
MNERWLNGFLSLVSSFRKFNVHTVFIYDTGSPQEKSIEKMKRRENFEKMEDRVYLLQESIDKFNDTGIADESLFEFQEKRKINNVSLLNPGKKVLDIKSIQYHVDKLKKHTTKIEKVDFENSKKILKLMNVPYYQAPLEAETACSDLCIRNLVKAVISEDSDVLAYGAPIFLTNYSCRDGSCDKYVYSEVIEAMDFTSDQFLDFCIMCGTDYNSNIPKIGSQKAYQLLKQYGSIEGIEKNTALDTSILNYKRVRKMFREYEKFNEPVGFCKMPDFPALHEFCVVKNIYVNIDSLKEQYKTKFLIIEDDEDEDIT